MKTLNIIIIFLFVIGSSCNAQKTLSELKNNQIKVAGYTYNINRSSNSFILIENSSNKLANVKPKRPNWPPNIPSFKKISINQALLNSIFKEVISANKIKLLPKDITDDLSVRIRADLEGNPIEISFVTDKKSILTVEELSLLERQIKKKIKIFIQEDFKKYLIGADFIVFDAQIQYKKL